MEEGHTHIHTLVLHTFKRGGGRWEHTHSFIESSWSHSVIHANTNKSTQEPVCFLKVDKYEKFKVKGRFRTYSPIVGPMLFGLGRFSAPQCLKGETTFSPFASDSTQRRVSAAAAAASACYPQTCTQTCFSRLKPLLLHPHTNLRAVHTEKLCETLSGSEMFPQTCQSSRNNHTRVETESAAHAWSHTAITQLLHSKQRQSPSHKVLTPAAQDTHTRQVFPQCFTFKLSN